MEISALYSVAKFRNMSILGVTAISDDVFEKNLKYDVEAATTGLHILIDAAAQSLIQKDQ